MLRREKCHGLYPCVLGTIKEDVPDLLKTEMRGGIYRRMQRVGNTFIQII